MIVIQFPKKEKCNCAYVYRIIFNPEAGLFGCEIAKKLGQDKVQMMTALAGFEHELEAEAAALGFLEALHYTKTGGTL